MEDFFAVVEPRSHAGLAVHLHKAGSRWLIRIAPARDPAQPRLWCLRADCCTRAGLRDPRVPTFLAARRLTREEMVQTLADLKADAGAWLAREDSGALRAWMLEAADLEPIDLSAMRATEEGMHAEEARLPSPRQAGQAAAAHDRRAAAAREPGRDHG